MWLDWNNLITLLVVLKYKKNDLKVKMFFVYRATVQLNIFVKKYNVHTVAGLWQNDVFPQHM